MSRRRGEETAISLDSLLDVMFNVVGILVLVLVLVQLSVTEAVQRLQTQAMELPDIDPEAMELAEEQVEELRRLVEELSRNAEVATRQMEEDRITMTRLEGQIERLREMVALDPELTAERERIEALLEERRKQQEQLAQETEEAGEELQRLRALLAETPPRVQPPDEVITLPNPRDAPQGWSAEYVLVANERVYVYDMARMRQRLQTSVQAVATRPEDAENTGGRVRDLLDRRLEVYPVRNQDFEIEMQAVGRHENIPRFYFNPREDGGTPAEELTESDSPFLALASGARRERNYIVFWVKPDSFQTYLRAREILDRYDIPAGWEIRHGNWRYAYTLGGGTYRLNQLKARIEEIDKAIAEREADRKPTPPRDTGPDIPPPKVDRDVSGPID